MASVAVGGRVEVTQIGDVTLKEQTDLMLVEDGGKVALLENKTTIAEVPQEDGTTAVLANVECTVRATDQQIEQELDLPATRRIPDNPRRAHPTTTPTTTPTTAPAPAPPPPPPPAPAPPPLATATATARRPAAAASINITHTDQHRSRTRQPRPSQRRLNNVTGGGGVQREYFVKRENPWRKCLHYFYILWMILLTCLGLVGLGYVGLGLGVLTHKCQKKESEDLVGIFELWTSSFVTGAIMVSFTLCVWLSCGAYFICCRERKDLCIGVVTGCGIIAGFLFIIAFSFNASAVGMTVDASPGVNGTLHDTDCLSPYWLAYVPPFASGTVLLAFLASLCCCVFCNGCFYIFCDLSDNRYDRL